MKTRFFYIMYQPKMYLKSIMEQIIPGQVMFLSRKICRVVAKLSMKRFLSGREKRKRKREDEKFREKLPKVTQYFQSRNLSVEVEDISDNVSSSSDNVSSAA